MVPNTVSFASRDILPLIDQLASTRALLDPALQGELDSVRSQLGLTETEIRFEVPDAIMVSQRLDQLLRDVRMLPQGVGSARPTNDDIQTVDNLSLSGAFDEIAAGLFSIMNQDGASAVSDYYNRLTIYDSKQAAFIWEKCMSHPEIASALSRVADILAQSIPGTDLSDQQKKELAYADIQKNLTHLPPQYITAKTPVMILLGRVKQGLIDSFMHIVTDKVAVDDMPLIEGGESVKNPELFQRSFEVAGLFQNMDQLAYIDMLDNPLGQAQTANPTQAESYFRQREAIPEMKVQNNFGYVYLSAAQAESLGLSPQQDAIFPFSYYNEQYVAIPAGLYFSKKSPDVFQASMDHLHALADAYSGTPAEEYYSSLIAYYMCGVDGSANVSDSKTFVKQYYDLCYVSERAWVRYISFAEKEQHQFIHIHPFEKYSTVSTKSHDLSLGITNPAETAQYVESKQRFQGNASRFFDQAGITGKHPEMIAETNRLIQSAGTISLSARFFSAIPGTLAQNIPNEEDGRQDGIVALFDTAFAKGAIKSSRGQVTRRSDPVGVIADAFDQDIDVPEKFMLHYIGVVLSHELNHNAYKGREGSFQSDGHGLEVKLIEEAKATVGMALAFNDPYNLSEADLTELRSSILLMATWMTMRLRPQLRAQYTSHQYFREGAVMIDHMMKSGLIKVVGMGLQEDGNFQPVSDAGLDTADFEFLRFDFTDDVLKDFIRRCADFLKDLSEPYYETQFKPDASPDRVVPDVTSVDFWQALLRTCYDEDIAKQKTNPKSTPSDIAGLEARKDAISLPADNDMLAKARALVRYSDFDSVQRFRQAVAKQHHVDLTDPSLDEHVKAAQQKIQSMYPAITG